MTVDDLIVEFRDEADDMVAPYLWSDARVISFINDAELEAAVRARFFIDSESNASRVKVKAATGVGKLDPNVIFVREARIVGIATRLRGVYRKDMRCWPGWEDDVGDPQRYIKDYTSAEIRIHPKPSADVVLQLTVVTGPVGDPLVAGDDLRTPIRYQRKLVNWVLYRAYLRKDSGNDARDDQRAAAALKSFEADFGPRLAAIDEVFQQQQEDVLDEQGGSW